MASWAKLWSLRGSKWKVKSFLKYKCKLPTLSCPFLLPFPLHLHIHPLFPTSLNYSQQLNEVRLEYIWWGGGGGKSINVKIKGGIAAASSTDTPLVRRLYCKPCVLHIGLATVFQKNKQTNKQNPTLLSDAFCQFFSWFTQF